MMDITMKMLFIFMVYIPTSLLADMLAPMWRPRSVDFDSHYVYIGTDWGINIFSKDNDSWINIDTDIAEAKYVLNRESPSRVLSVLSDGEWIWACVWEREGIYRVNKVTGHADRWSYHTPDPEIPEFGAHPFPMRILHTIKKDRKGNLLFVSHAGLTQFDGNDWVVFRYHHLSSEIDALVTSVSADEENRLWIGVNNSYSAYYEPDGPEKEYVNGGIILYDGKTWQHFYAHNYHLAHEDSLHIKTPLLSNFVSCVEVDGSCVWIGTDVGVSVYDYEADSWQNFDTLDSEILSAVTSIAITPDEIWIGSGYGIARYNKENNKWIGYDNSVLPLNHIVSVAYDAYDRAIWAAAYLGTYIYRFHNDKWHTYSPKDRLVTNDPIEIYNLGEFLKNWSLWNEAYTVFEEFIQIYPKHEKIPQVKEALLFLQNKL